MNENKSFSINTAAPASFAKCFGGIVVHFLGETFPLAVTSDSHQLALFNVFINATDSVRQKTAVTLKYLRGEKEGDGVSNIKNKILWGIRCNKNSWCYSTGMMKQLINDTFVCMKQDKWLTVTTSFTVGNNTELTFDEFIYKNGIKNKYGTPGCSISL